MEQQTNRVWLIVLIVIITVVIVGGGLLFWRQSLRFSRQIQDTESVSKKDSQSQDCEKDIDCIPFVFECGACADNSIAISKKFISKYRNLYFEKCREKEMRICAALPEGVSKCENNKCILVNWYNDNDNGIKFKYPAELNIQEGFGGSGVSFWSLVKAEHKCSPNSDCLDEGLVFAFDYKVEDGDNLEEAYKKSSFYKDDAKNLVDKTIISVAGNQALLARFCDEWKTGNDCDGGKRSVREIFIVRNNKYYIFRFGGVGGSFEKSVLESVVFIK